MGALTSRSWLWGQKIQFNVLLLGLDCAGKTTLLYTITRLGEVEEINRSIPTIGFSIEKRVLTTDVAELTFTAWDVSCSEKLRPLTPHFYQQADAVIFMVDAHDHERLDSSEWCCAKEEIHKVLTDNTLRALPLLVLANKQDMPLALSAHELEARLDLLDVTDRPIRVQGCSALHLEGVWAGVNWLQQTRLQMNQGVDCRNCLAKRKVELLTQALNQTLPIVLLHLVLAYVPFGNAYECTRGGQPAAGPIA